MQFDRLFESEAECEAESEAECEAYFTVVCEQTNYIAAATSIIIKYNNHLNISINAFQTNTFIGYFASCCHNIRFSSPFV